MCLCPSKLFVLGKTSRIHREGSDRSFIWFLLCYLKNMSYLFQLKTKERKKEEEISDMIWLWLRKQVKTKEKRNANSRKWWLETTTTTTKLFVPSILGWLHEPKENYARSGTWISFLHSFLSSNMLSLRPLASISCRITSIHVFFGLPCALLTFPNLTCSTRRTGASIDLCRTWSNHHRWFSLIFSSIEAAPILIWISSFLILSSSCYHTSNEAHSSLLHSSSGHDISLYPNILCHIIKLA